MKNIDTAVSHWPQQDWTTQPHPHCFLIWDRKWPPWASTGSRGPFPELMGFVPWGRGYPWEEAPNWSHSSIITWVMLYSPMLPEPSKMQVSELLWNSDWWHSDPGHLKGEQSLLSQWLSLQGPKQRQRWSYGRVYCLHVSCLLLWSSGHHPIEEACSVLCGPLPKPTLREREKDLNAEYAAEAPLTSLATIRRVCPSSREHTKSMELTVRSLRSVFSCQMVNSTSTCLQFMTMSI